MRRDRPPSSASPLCYRGAQLDATERDADGSVSVRACDLETIAFRTLGGFHRCRCLCGVMMVQQSGFDAGYGRYYCTWGPAARYRL